MLIEVLFLFSVISLLLLVNSKIIIENMKKCSLYKINDDVLSLSSEESSLINEVILDITKNREIFEKIKNNDELKSFNYIHEYSKNNKLEIKIVNGKMFLIKNDRNSNLYRAMIFEIRKDKEIEKLVIIPEKYIAYNMDL